MSHTYHHTPDPVIVSFTPQTGFAQCPDPCHVPAGVSRDGKKHIRTSTASKGDLQLFIQLALGDLYDPAHSPDVAVPKALSHVLKEDVSKAQADQWLRRSNSGAPYFVSPELEDKLHAAHAVRTVALLVAFLLCTKCHFVSPKMYCKLHAAHAVLVLCSCSGDYICWWTTPMLVSCVVDKLNASHLVHACASLLSHVCL